MSTHDTEPINMYWLLVISLSVLTIGWFGFISDYKNQFDRAIRNELELKESYERKQHIRTNLSTYQQQMITVRNRLDSMKFRLPSQFDKETIKSTLNENIKDYEVKFVSFDFDRERPREFYSELPFTLVLTGNYSALYYYLYDHFYSSHHGLKLDNIHLHRTDSNDELHLTVTGRKYRYIEEGEL